MHLDTAVSAARVFVKQWSSAGQSLGFLLQYSKKLSTVTTNLLQAVQGVWSLSNSYRPPDSLLRQLQRYAWLPMLCEAVMCLKDCCSSQQMAGSSDHAAAEAMQHADTAILALGSLLLAICRWCNLSQLLHTAEQQGAPRSAAAFRELFQQAWCHAAVFLLANYTAVLVALLRQDVQQQQQQQQLPPGAARSPSQQQRAGRASPLQQGMRASRQEQVQQQLLQALSLDMPMLQQQQQQQQVACSASASAADRAAPPSPQQNLQQQQPLLSTAAVWREVQLPAAHCAWVPPSDPEVWRSQGLGVTNSAAAELQLLLMLWGWAIRRAPAAGLEHHTSCDMLLLLLEAAWLLDVCPAAASHQKRGLCLWSTPAHMLRLLAQPVLPPEEAADEAAADRHAKQQQAEEAEAASEQLGEEAGAATPAESASGQAASQTNGQQRDGVPADQEQQQEQRQELLRLLQHPGLAGCVVQLPLELLKALQPLSDARLKQAALHFSRLDDTVRRLMEMPTLLLQVEDGLNTAAASSQQQQQQTGQQQPQQQQLLLLQTTGLREQHSLQLLQLAEVYLRCQHLSRVVGLEAGQLLAAVLPITAVRLLHVFSSRELTAGLAALVITRCKALRVLTAEMLEQQQQGLQHLVAAAEHDTGQAGGSEPADDSSSSSSSGSSPEFGGRHASRGACSDGDSSDDEDSVSISSWCSTSSSILDSPGVLLHEKHLAVGGMALHMMEQATAWLNIITVWQGRPSEANCSSQLSAADIARQLDAALSQGSSVKAAQLFTEALASSTSDTSSSDADTCPPAAAKASSNGSSSSSSAAEAPSASSSDVGVAAVDALVAACLPMACCMMQHAAAVLQQLLPVWATIAPNWQEAASTAAGSSSSSGSSSSESDADSSCEDEAVPSLKEIAAHHQLMVAQHIVPHMLSLAAAMPTIEQALQGSHKQFVLAAAVAVTRSAPVSDPAGHQEASASACGSGLLASNMQVQGLGAQQHAALACLAQLPFAFSDVLQAAAGAAADIAKAGLGTGAGSKQRSSSAQATPSASPQQPASSLQPSPRSSGSSSRSWGCHYAGCTNLSGVSELAMPVYGCSGCRGADYSHPCTYCSSACQQADWPVHKLVCRQVRRQSSKGQQQQQQQ
uniref:MYND-type domain-containing protein n=1 Tax=Tetradesmus obliquus TaxID=3088 RepID=A0A383VJL8_TETOB|eukprot:jgi/Sobl393_1/825/SZX64566.1